MIWMLLGGAVAVVALAAVIALAYRHRDSLKSRLAPEQDIQRTAASALLSYRAKAFVTSVVVIAVAAAVLWFSWTYAGPVSTIVYTVLFIVFATLFPGAILLFGSLLPGSSMIGKLHGALGAFAFGGLALVQRDDGWQLCPARRKTVYIDSEWHDVPEGQDNLSVLWWNQFGMVRYKDDGTLAPVRVDTVAERQRSAAADGGSVTRGTYRQQKPPGVSGQDGTWVVDLKRLVGQGIKKIGDIELIETAEEITSREHAKEGLTAGWEPILGSIVGLIIGVATGYVLLGGV